MKYSMVKSGNNSPLTFLLKPGAELPQGSRMRTVSRDLHEGDWCPVCGVEKLVYDGLLNLGCPHCGHALGGCFT